MAKDRKKAPKEASKTFHDIMKASVKSISRDNLIMQIQENISGIWVNPKYHLLLGLPPSSTFTFGDGEEFSMGGDYSIVQPRDSPYITLRLVDAEEGLTRDYIIIEIKAFDTLIISHEGETIHFKNVAPDDYEKGNY
jgi:hypothetical protein